MTYWWICILSQCNLDLLVQNMQIDQITHGQNLKMFMSQCTSLLNRTQLCNAILLNECFQIDQQHNINVYTLHYNGKRDFKILQGCICALMGCAQSTAFIL